MLNFLKLNKEEKIVFISGILGGFLSRGILLFSLGYAIDDYGFMPAPNNFFSGIEQGRWGTFIFSKFFGLLGVQSVFSTTLLVFTSFIILSYVGILICRIWNINKNIPLSLLVVLIFVTFPYQAEIFTFKCTNIMFTFSILFSFLSLYLSRFNKKALILTSLLFAFSLSMYQIALSYILVVFVFSIILFHLNNKNDNFLLKIKNFFKDSINKTRILTISLGVIIYFILNKIILTIFNRNIAERGQLLNIGDPGIFFKRIIEIKDILFKVFFKVESIMPISLKLILSFLIIFSIFGVLYYLFNKKNVKNSLLNIFYFLFLLIFFSISFLIPLSILKEWWPVPRVLASISLFYGGIFVLFSYYCNFKYKNNILLILGSFLIIGFIAVNNHIYIDQMRMNALDENKANRIVSRLEMDVNFSKVKSLAIIGGSWAYLIPINTIVGDMNISAFGAEWAKIPLINEISGYNFLAPSIEQQLFANDYCKNSSKWPTNGSVFVNGELGIVCL